MGVNSVTGATGVAVATTAETAVAVTPAIQTQQGDPIGVLIEATLIVSPGTGATGVTVFCRYGNGITGAQVEGSWAFSGMTAGNRYAVSAVFLDASNASAQALGQQYTISVQQTGAPTAAGTAPNVKVLVEV